MIPEKAPYFKESHLELGPSPADVESAILARTTSVTSEKFPIQAANLARTVVRRVITLNKIDILNTGEKAVAVCIIN